MNDRRAITSDVDLIVEDHGSFWLLRPFTQAARAWMEECVEDGADPSRWFAGALPCEPRYVTAIVQVAEADGLKVEVA